ncbi:MAG: 23S rRNA (pseudouridine(1915)-N(3))-methyltransferase RlmH [Clostridiales bacterium]|nr:23S rRNA (pseudouridine(1915)-N(3))-methyltransferase RlmH [Clostridiales bacterium]
MKITFISVGKIKESFYTKQIEGHLKNIKKYAQVQVIEVPDEKCPEKLSDKEMIQVKNKEGERILSKINSGDFVIALAIEGKIISTADFKSLIKKKQASSIVFVIGGSLGLSDEVLKRSNYKLSFSRLTFPHQLMKVLLTEQVYEVVK